MEDLYTILGVTKKATKKELREAYYTLAKKYHPDRNNGAHSEEFAKISSAYSVLSDPKRRKLYDKTGTVDKFDLRTVAIQVLAGMFHYIIGDPTINVKTEDILKRMACMIEEKMRETQQHITNLNKVKVRLNDVRDRISGKDHFFKQMVDGNLEQNAQVLMTKQKDLEVGKTALEILKGYKYAIDEKPGKFGTFLGIGTFHDEDECSIRDR